MLIAICNALMCSKMAERPSLVAKDDQERGAIPKVKKVDKIDHDSLPANTEAPSKCSVSTRFSASILARFRNLGEGPLNTLDPNVSFYRKITPP